MSELRVPKRRVPVELMLHGGGSQKVSLFLADFASEHTGGERISDALNGGGDFIPALAEQGMILLNRHSVLVVSFSVNDDMTDAERLTVPSEQVVRVRLVDGTQLDGVITYLRPPESSRPIDYLNEGTTFLRMTQQEKVLLIHKRSIADVTLL